MATNRKTSSEEWKEFLFFLDSINQKEAYIHCLVTCGRGWAAKKIDTLDKLRRDGKPHLFVDLSFPWRYTPQGFDHWSLVSQYWADYMYMKYKGVPMLGLVK